MPRSKSTTAVITLVLVLLIVSFYESRRVKVLGGQIENPIFRALSLAYASGAENLKSSVGLVPFFDTEDAVWKNLKNEPEKQIELPAILLVADPYLEPTVQPSTISQSYNILLIGDSFMAESFGPALEAELLTFADTKVFRKGVFSTGLSRPDYFNWEDELTKLVLEKNSTTVFVMFGANDAQDQTSLGGKTINYYAKNWNEEYGKRVARILKILEDNHVFTFWIGNPMASDQRYTDRMANLNSIYKAVCGEHSGCLYLDTWAALATLEGKYSAYLPDENGQKRLARASDGIHTTAFGSQLMLKNIMGKVVGKMKFKKVE